MRSEGTLSPELAKQLALAAAGKVTENGKSKDDFPAAKAFIENTLSANGIDINKPILPGGETLLYAAAKANNPAMVQFLIKMEANPNARNKNPKDQNTYTGGLPLFASIDVSGKIAESVEDNKRVAMVIDALLQGPIPLDITQRSGGISVPQAILDARWDGGAFREVGGTPEGRDKILIREFAQKERKALLKGERHIIEVDRKWNQLVIGKKFRGYEQVGLGLDTVPWIIIPLEKGIDLPFHKFLGLDEEEVTEEKVNERYRAVANALTAANMQEVLERLNEAKSKVGTVKDREVEPVVVKEGLVATVPVLPAIAPDRSAEAAKPAASPISAADKPKEKWAPTLPKDPAEQLRLLALAAEGKIPKASDAAIAAKGKRKEETEEENTEKAQAYIAAYFKANPGKINDSILEGNQTMLYRAAQAYNPEMVEFLIRKMYANPNTPNKGGGDLPLFVSITARGSIMGENEALQGARVIDKLLAGTGSLEKPMGGADVTLERRGETILQAISVARWDAPTWPMDHKIITQYAEKERAAILSGEDGSVAVKVVDAKGVVPPEKIELMIGKEIERYEDVKNPTKPKVPIRIILSECSKLSPHPDQLLGLNGEGVEKGKVEKRHKAIMNALAQGKEAALDRSRFELIERAKDENSRQGRKIKTEAEVEAEVREKIKTEAEKIEKVFNGAVEIFNDARDQMLGKEQDRASYSEGPEHTASSASLQSVSAMRSVAALPPASEAALPNTSGGVGSPLNGETFQTTSLTDVGPGSQVRPAQVPVGAQSTESATATPVSVPVAPSQVQAAPQNLFKIIAGRISSAFSGLASTIGWGRKAESTAAAILAVEVPPAPVRPEQSSPAPAASAQSTQSATVHIAVAPASQQSVPAVPETGALRVEEISDTSLPSSEVQSVISGTSTPRGVVAQSRVPSGAASVNNPSFSQNSIAAIAPASQASLAASRKTLPTPGGFTEQLPEQGSFVGRQGSFVGRVDKQKGSVVRVTRPPSAAPTFAGREVDKRERADGHGNSISSL